MEALKYIGILRQILKAGSIVFGLSAIFLLALPSLFLELLELEVSDTLSWSMRMIGITLVALSGNMYVGSKFAPDNALIMVAKVMAISAFGLGFLTLLIPAKLSLFSLAYALIGFIFSSAYALFLWKLSRIK
ncbi:MAG: hypothetical protein GM45_3930 [actinobacterium acAMD-5]|nr:MAG: hypothetical protein GM45_3930 [actinobacterium acAMD-5]